MRTAEMAMAARPTTAFGTCVIAAELPLGAEYTGKVTETWGAPGYTGPGEVMFVDAATIVTGSR